MNWRTVGQSLISQTRRGLATHGQNPRHHVAACLPTCLYRGQGEWSLNVGLDSSLLAHQAPCSSSAVLDAPAAALSVNFCATGPLIAAVILRCKSARNYKLVGN